MSSVNDRLSTVLIEKFGVPAAEVASDPTFEELRFDSLALAELAVTLQEEFGVEVSDDDLPAGLTVGALVELLESKVVAA